MGPPVELETWIVRCSFTPVGKIRILAMEDPVFPFASVAVEVTMNTPVALYVGLKLAPDPVEGDPPAEVQARVYGGTPPDATALNTTVEPVYPKVGPLICTDTFGRLVSVKLPELCMWAVSPV